LGRPLKGWKEILFCNVHNRCQEVLTLERMKIGYPVLTAPSAAETASRHRLVQT